MCCSISLTSLFWRFCFTYLFIIELHICCRHTEKINQCWTMHGVLERWKGIIVKYYLRVCTIQITLGLGLKLKNECLGFLVLAHLSIHFTVINKLRVDITIIYKINYGWVFFWQKIMDELKYNLLFFISDWDYNTCFTLFLLQMSQSRN